MAFIFQEGLVFWCLYWHFNSALIILNLFVLLWKKLCCKNHELLDSASELVFGVLQIDFRYFFLQK